MKVFSLSLWSTAAVFAASLAPVSAQATTQVESVPPGYNATCNCYRNVPYGTVSWFEPTTRRVAKQVMDVWMPAAANQTGTMPIAYYGHPNGSTHTISMDKTAGSAWSRLIKPLLDRGFVVVSYEFRHPVVNYVEGKPAPRYDIQKAINTFSGSHALSLGADPSNSFILGQSRGGGLGIQTALTGKFYNGTHVRAVWTYQAQTSFDCNEMATTFVIESDRDAFLAQCTSVPNAGSSLSSVSPSAPPVVASYEHRFHKTLVPASEVDVHHPDFGWQLCVRYSAQEVAAKCQPNEVVDQANAWVGMADYFTAHLQPPV